MYNNYFSLKELSIQDVFEDLTGCPTFTMPIDFSYDQIKRLEQLLSQGTLVSLFTAEDIREFENDDFNP